MKKKKVDIMELDSTLLSKKSKIIHQIWFERGILPRYSSRKLLASLQKHRDSWINKNDSWHYHLWGADECLYFMKQFYPEHLPLYKSYQFAIQRCDCVRYFILHRYGGLYADADYVCCRPWDEVIEKYDKDIYFVETPNKIGKGVHVSNSLMYSAKQNSTFWKNIFIELELNKEVPSYYGKHMTIMYSTGPCIINRAFKKYRNNRVSYYPVENFHPFGITTDVHILENKDNIYAYHLGASSWTSFDCHIFSLVYKEYKIILLILLYLIIQHFLS